MALSIFLALNGFAVAFLLYVLANFWREARRFARAPRSVHSRGSEADGSSMVVITHPISHAAQGGVSVIPFPVKRVAVSRNLIHIPESGQTLPRASVLRISIR